jgi:biopolymer transport protein ExbB
MVATLYVHAMLFFFQAGNPGASSWDLRSMWSQMSALPRSVVVILFVLSIYSFGVMIDRALMYSAARKQSRVFVQQVAGALKDGKLDEAIAIAERNKKSHIAKVVATGLSEFQSASQQVSDADVIEAAKRGLERSVAIVHAEMKRGLSALATIGSTAPFVGLFGTVVGILNAFKGIEQSKATGLSAVAGRYRGSVGNHGAGPSRGRSRGVGVQLFHQQSRSIRRGDGQLLDGAYQLLHPASRKQKVGNIHACTSNTRALQAAGWESDGLSQRHPHGGHHAGAVDHLHGGHAHVAEGPSGGLGQDEYCQGYAGRG